MYVHVYQRNLSIMNPKVVLVARYLLALMMLVFGLNKFLQFLPPPELSGEAGAYFGAIMSANVITIVAILEIVSGIALILGRYLGLVIIFNAAMSFNALLFHLSLDPAGTGPAALWAVLVVVLFIANREKFYEVLKA